MIGRQFTWANSLPFPTYEKLDRVLMDANWESKFPLVSVRALERIEGFSDHAPILLTTGNHYHLVIIASNLNLDGYNGMCSMIWSSRFGDRPVTTLSPIQRWNYKIRALCSHLSGWARHITSVLKKEKLRLSSIIDDLEALAEIGPLSTQEIE
jgi:hypothetical protein